MSKKIKEILHYILEEYPYPNDLTKTRITKLFYLIDWESMCEQQKQITDINWYFDHYGPFVSDVLDAADEDKDVKINKTISAYGGVKYIVQSKLEKGKLKFALDSNEKRIIQKVIDDTKKFTWNEFIDYVYNTPPIKNSKQYGNLNLNNFI